MPPRSRARRREGLAAARASLAGGDHSAPAADLNLQPIRGAARAAARRRRPGAAGRRPAETWKCLVPRAVVAH
eukprot:1208075-Pyramimonas_sp.AAC.1